MGLDVATDSQELLPELAELPGTSCGGLRRGSRMHLGRVLPPGVDSRAYAALLGLAGGETCSQQALADTISVSRTSMVKVAAEPADQRLIERVGNTEDRRAPTPSPAPPRARPPPAAGAGTSRTSDALTTSFTLAEREELGRLLLGIVEDSLAPDTSEPVAQEPRLPRLGRTSRCTGHSWPHWSRSGSRMLVRRVRPANTG